MIIKLLVDGGDMKPSPAIAQKLGPLGINIGKIIQSVNSATMPFKGMKVPVMLNINTKTKNFTTEVGSPPTAELLKRELGAEKGSSTPNKLKIGNMAIEQVISIAKTKSEGMLVNSMKSAVKSVLGSCQSLGILVESKEPLAVTEEVDKGLHDKTISEQPALSEEKRTKLQNDFEVVKKAQEEIMKKEEEARKAKEAEAAAAAPKAEEKKAAAPEEKKEVKAEEKEKVKK